MAKRTRTYVLGTAGHIDHGKTSLVRALTGRDTDRLPEEKKRGITIELGFAPWEVAPGKIASIVDVPGHEGFVRTMVAGAGGIDALMLVVSAEDGVMPQTREHLNVCRLLGIERGIVALTKVDRLEGDAEATELAIADVREALAGTGLDEAPILPCSATTGEGIETIRRGVKTMLEALEPPATAGPPIVPIDRVFTLKGHGTVVTGTLVRGTLDVADDAAARLIPGGEGTARPVRIRTLQVRDAPVTRATASCRVALNLAGTEVGEIHRGDVITRGDAVRTSSIVHAWLEHLPHGARPWKRDTALEICVGTTHTTGRIDPLADPAGESTSTVAPGSRALVRIRLDTPVPAYWGQRIIVRDFARTAEAASTSDHGRTVGGGQVVDPAPSTGRRMRPVWIESGLALAEPDGARRLASLVATAGASGITLQDAAFRGGLQTPDALLAGLEKTVVSAGDRLVDRPTLDKLVHAAVAAADRFHSAHPTETGVGRAALEGQLPPPVSPAVAAAAVDLALQRGGLESAGGDLLARPGKGFRSDDALPPALVALRDHYQAAGITPPTVKDVQGQFRMTPRQCMAALGTLQRTGDLIRVTADISFHHSAHEELVGRVRTHLHTSGSIDVQDLKQMTGLSRKYAVPFLEHLDQLGVTRREGDRRVPGPRAG